MTKAKPEKRPMRDRATQARKTSAILALVSTSTIEEAAKLCKVGRSTMFRWMDDPGFMDDLTAARSTAFTAGLNTLKGAVEKAVAVLVALMDSRSEAIRRGAAVNVIELALHAQEGAEMEARFVRLENAVAGRNNF